MVKFIRPAPADSEAVTTVRDYLSLLVELNTLIGKDNRTDAALLYIICQENNDR